MLEQIAESTHAATHSELGDGPFDECRAEGAAMSLDEAIAYARRARGRRQRPANGWASLTPTETAVVARVGEGLTNHEIGARLFMSPRTVATHLTHVYAKLGYSSRSELAAHAARRSTN